LASALVSVDFIKLVLDKGMSDNLTDTDVFTALYISVGCGNLEAKKSFVERRAVLNNSKNMSPHWWWMYKVQKSLITSQKY
jgi:ankyrin repeat protein